MRIRSVKTYDEFKAIEHIWKDLERNDVTAGVFQSWAWNDIWYKYVLSKQKNQNLNIKLIEDSAGTPLALIPLFTKPLVGSFGKITQFTGHRMSFCNDILVSVSFDDGFYSSLINSLKKDVAWDEVIHLRHLRGESKFAEMLLKQGMAVKQYNRIVIVADPTIKEQFRRLGKSARKTFRSQVNQMNRNYSCRNEVVTKENFGSAFDELIKLHKMRFESKKRSTLLVDENLEFLKAVSSYYSDQGKCEVVRLIANDSTIASALMMKDKGCYYMINLGFNTEFSRYSPMRILTAETIRHGFENLGCEFYELGPGYEAYKYQWKPKLYPNYYCCIGGDSPISITLANTYCYGFRKSLPKADVSKHDK